MTTKRPASLYYAEGTRAHLVWEIGNSGWFAPRCDSAKHKRYQFRPGPRSDVKPFTSAAVLLVKRCVTCDWSAVARHNQQQPTLTEGIEA